MDEAVSIESRPRDDVLVVRVWFEGPDAREGFRARVLTGSDGGTVAVVTPGQVVGLVQRWLSALVEDPPPDGRSP